MKTKNKEPFMKNARNNNGIASQPKKDKGSYECEFEAVFVRYLWDSFFLDSSRSFYVRFTKKKTSKKQSKKNN